MPANTYTEISDDRVAVGGDLDEDIHDDLRDNQLAARTNTAWVRFDEVSTTTTGSYQSLHTHYEWFPNLGNWTGISPRMVVSFEAKVTGGNADYRLVEVGAAVNGTPVNVTSATYVEVTCGVAVATGDLGGEREFRLETIINAGTQAYAKARDRSDSYKDF